MKLESHVSNLELSERLEKLGVKQDSQWYWCCGNLFHISLDDAYDHYCMHHLEDEITAPVVDWIGNFKNQACSAFTVAELGEMLPQYIKYEANYYILKTTKGDEAWAVDYEYETKEQKLRVGMTKETEADARASMLIYLLENKLIKEKK